MNPIVLGVTLLVVSTGVPPAVDTSRTAVKPAAFTFDLPEAAAAPHAGPHHLLDEQSRRVWRRTSVPPVQGTTAKRFTKTDRIIAVAAGAAVGWLAGGAIGYAITSKSNSADDVSGLRGVVVGAPIGAVVGAIFGHWLTQ